MAVNTQLTLLELVKRISPDGNLLTIAEVLHETNDVMNDIPWIEANGITSHKEVRRASLPTGTWRRLNAGVAAEASQTDPIEDPIGILEAWSTPDKALIDMAPDPAGKRMQEAEAFIEGMGQNFVNKLFYATNSVPEQFTGFSSRLGTIDSDMVWGAGGTGSDVTSIFVIQWGVNQVFCIYPKNSPTVGIQHTDMGIDTKADGSSNDYLIYRDHFKFNGGLCVKDVRCAGRIANHESTGASNIFDEDNLIKLLNKMKRGGTGAVIYCNDTLKSQMEIRLKDKTNVNFTVDNGLGGVQVMRFRGLPVKMCDQIVNTESAIS